MSDELEQSSPNQGLWQRSWNELYGGQKFAIAFNIFVGFLNLFTWFFSGSIFSLVMFPINFGLAIFMYCKFGLVPVWDEDAPTNNQLLLDESVEAQRLQRQEEARTTFFPLAYSPNISGMPEYVELRIQPFGLDPAKPIQLIFNSNQLRRLELYGANLGVVFPEAEVDDSGTITTYGKIAVLYGEEFSGLEIWEIHDPVQVEAKQIAEAPFMWQVPVKYRQQL